MGHPPNDMIREFLPGPVSESALPERVAGAERWIGAERLWTALRRRLPESCHFQVRYEEPLEGPRESLEAICSFLPIPFDEAMPSLPDKFFLNRDRRC